MPPNRVFIRLHPLWWPAAGHEALLDSRGSVSLADSTPPLLSSDCQKLWNNRPQAHLAGETALRNRPMPLTLTYPGWPNPLFRGADHRFLWSAGLRSSRFSAFAPQSKWHWAKPPALPLGIQHLPWWRRRFRLRAAIFSQLLKEPCDLPKTVTHPRMARYDVGVAKLYSKCGLRDRGRSAARRIWDWFDAGRLNRPLLAIRHP